MVNNGRIYCTAIFLLALAIFASGCIKNFEEESNIIITDTELSADKVTSSFVDINVTTYILHTSGVQKNDTSLELKVFDSNTDFLKSRKVIDIGHIKEGEKSSVSQSIRLPREGTYRVEFMLSDGNKTKSTAEIYLSGLERLKTDVQEIGIGIDSMDFLVRKVVGNNVVIETDVYLTNSGSLATEDYKMLVKAREMDARLIADKVWTTTGLIGPEETVVRSVNLTVPDNYNYVVEVLIWKDNVLVKRGEDYVQLNPQKVIDKNKTVESKDIVTSDFIVETPTMPGEMPAYNETPYEGTQTPGFGSGLAIISLIAAFFIFRRRSV
ncbi:PGF-CTERM sorting domain-containing protein [uncultured Methanomethylovorans sp.]|uniref:DUF7490 domain-containing protein n=1 Tax=uncultured Methanomethylovorans sp. TaxID=183759 RepID=UPI002AA85861|nr:PGF-CTERM sorting domain-containing protein [uncultured Methanomethylovorans sp.]